MFGMRRREFVALLGGAAATWPLAARAQQPATPVIGFLHGASSDLAASQLDDIPQGPKGRRLRRWREPDDRIPLAQGRPDALPAMAADLVRRWVT